jgi:hypothetical protein
MLQVPLDHLRESHLQTLVDNAEEESAQLEFKRELNLGDRKEKAEAAKDVAALANAAGGRILYGVDEQPVAGKSDRKAAAALRPLTDGKLKEQLESILADSISPRVDLRMRAVDLKSGFVLVVEVLPSDHAIHMVIGYDDHRYYKRVETSVRKMDERDVHRRYSEIERLKSGKSDRTAQVLREEVAPANNLLRCSTIIIPFGSSTAAIDPNELLQVDLQRACREVIHHGFELVSRSLQLTPDAIEYIGGDSRASAEDLFRMRSDGVVHVANVSYMKPIQVSKTRAMRWDPDSILSDVLIASRLAHIAWNHSGIRGPFAVIVKIGTPKGVPMIAYDGPPRQGVIGPQEAPIQAEYEGSFHGEDFGEVAASALLRRLWRFSGSASCPLFDAEGRLLNGIRSRFFRS